MIGVVMLVLLVLTMVGGPVGLSMGRQEPGLRRVIPRVAATLVGVLTCVWVWSLGRPDSYYEPGSGRRYWDANPSMRPLAAIAVATAIAVTVLLAIAARRWRADAMTTTPAIVIIGLLGMPVVAIALFVTAAAIGGGH